MASTRVLWHRAHPCECECEVVSLCISILWQGERRKRCERAEPKRELRLIFFFPNGGSCGYDEDANSLGSALPEDGVVCGRYWSFQGNQILAKVSTIYRHLNVHAATHVRFPLSLKPSHAHLRKTRAEPRTAAV